MAPARARGTGAGQSPPPAVAASGAQAGSLRVHAGRLKRVYSKIAMRDSSTMTRRRMLETLGVLGVAAASGVLAPPPASAQQLGLNESVDVAMKRVFGG